MDIFYDSVLYEQRKYVCLDGYNAFASTFTPQHESPAVYDLYNI